jgi:type VI secretion system protein ImpM
LVQVPPPGWHGKLPVLGDFASRRLDQDFLEAWDGWLAASMSVLRERSESTWLEAYLASPSWRFLLMPGVLGGAAGEQAWAGVLMPSVDRVGRYFPFTIAQPLGAGNMSTPQMQALWQWLGGLDDLAANAMYSDWSIERLESELASMVGPDLDEQAPPRIAMPGSDAPIWSTLEPGLDPAAWIDMEAQTLWSEHAHGIAYWYSCAEQTAPQLMRSRGLPDASAVQVLFGGAPEDTATDVPGGQLPVD